MNVHRSIRGRLSPATLLVLGVLITPSWLPTHAAGPTNWFVSFQRVQVAPVSRSDTTQLYEAGTIDTDGFAELVFSLGGEFKEAIPDVEVFDYLLRNEGHIVFPLEARVEIGGQPGAIFISEQQTAKVAFARYRVYFYNETTSGANVSLFVYRTR